MENLSLLGGGQDTSWMTIVDSRIISLREREIVLFHKIGPVSSAELPKHVARQCLSIIRTLPTSGEIMLVEVACCI